MPETEEIIRNAIKCWGIDMIAEYNKLNNKTQDGTKMLNMKDKIIVMLNMNPVVKMITKLNRILYEEAIKLFELDFKDIVRPIIKELELWLAVANAELKRINQLLINELEDAKVTFENATTLDKQFNDIEQFVGKSDFYPEEVLKNNSQKAFEYYKSEAAYMDSRSYIDAVLKGVMSLGIHTIYHSGLKQKLANIHGESIKEEYIRSIASIKEMINFYA